MNKLIYTDDLPDELLTALDGRVSTFYDSNQSIKSASSSAISKELMEQHLPDDKHFAVHYIGLGAHEMYGPNRNGDAWPEKGLAHETGNYGTHTFVKNGHYFREHKNRDPKKAIGSIRAAVYNRKMKRSEVIVWGDKRKAEKEYEDAKAGKQLDCSMSARVPGDRCNICDHFAKSSAVYCDHAKKHLTKWVAKHNKFAFVINDEPNFFDLSAVANKADRIASHLEVRLGHEKSASFGGFMFSDERATAAGVMLPDSIEYGCCNPKLQRLLEKCASIQKSTLHLDVLMRKQAAQYAFVEPTTQTQLTAMRELHPDVLFSFFAKQASTLPFDAFVAYVSNKSLSELQDDTNYKQAAARLDDLFEITMQSIINPETEKMVTPCDNVKLASFGPNFSDEQTLKELSEHNTLKLADARQRMLYNCAQSKSASINVNTVKSELSTQARNWLQAYGLYKVAAVNHMADLFGQDFIDDNVLLLLVSQHTN